MSYRYFIFLQLNRLSLVRLQMYTDTQECIPTDMKSCTLDTQRGSVPPEEGTHSTLLLWRKDSSCGIPM